MPLGSSSAAPVMSPGPSLLISGMRSSSVNPGARAADHLGPLRRVAADERGVILRRAAAAFAAELLEALLRLRLGNRGIDRCIQPVEHRPGQACGGDYPGPGGDLVARHARLVERRQFGQAGGAL